MSLIPENDNTNSFKVFLRIKPDPDFGNTITIEDGSKLVCRPPNTSKGYRNSEKAEYKFSKILKPEAKQQEIFEETVLPCINDLIKNQNGLLFSYGTTNAGKTYTVQGDVRNPGLIPRSLHVIFKKIKPVEKIKFAPHNAAEVRKLNINESNSVLSQKNDILRMHASSKSRGGVYPINEICDEYSKLSEGFEDYSCDQIGVLPTCSVWVSFIEIYNEVIHDLLEPYSGSSRTQLKLSADGRKNYFVKGLKQICVQNAAEAYSIYLYGKKNLNFACTKMNENSSRSHCIFVIKLLNQSDPESATLSNLSICDLAGTERQTKTQNTGLRLSEAKCINLSLFTLNRCLKTLRENQLSSTSQVMPYRSSKLTQFLCSALLERNEGKVIMIVNINPSQELYDETQQVLKVCAMAHEIRIKAMSTRNIRYKTRFSALVYENESEAEPYRPYDLKSCYENGNAQIVEELNEKISKLTEELQKKDESIADLHKKYKKTLTDSSKIHKEFELMTNEMKQSCDRRIQSIENYYKSKLELNKSSGVNGSAQLENLELRSKLTEMEAAMAALQLENEKKLKAKDLETDLLNQQLLESKEKIKDLESLLNEAKVEYKNLDKQLENAAINYSTYQEQNEALQLTVDSLEQAIEYLQIELESEDKEIEKLIGDEENIESKKKTEEKEKPLNPNDEVILSPDDFGSDREIFREVYLSSIFSSGENHPTGGGDPVPSCSGVTFDRSGAVYSNNPIPSCSGYSSARKTAQKENQLKGIPTLIDAHEAGSENASRCTLIIVKGDAAKALAVAGLSVTGSNFYGVFVLSNNNIINVRDASKVQIKKNDSVTNLVRTIGLDYQERYDSEEKVRKLRYRKIMMMMDRDQEGSLAKGLVINFIHFNWPGLLKMNFLEEFITPIVKVLGKSDTISFFSEEEFFEWTASTPNWSLLRIKYYSGLDTSTSDEAKEYFLKMASHRIKFLHEDNADDSRIAMAFSRKEAEARKDWLSKWMEETKRRKELNLGKEYLYGKDTKAVTYKDFIDKELVRYSNMDNERSIPSMMDGLKPGSRKVLFTCLRKNLSEELKVARLAGSVAELSAYHYGETSLKSTIINLAQNYVGSNNINLLQPIGQFGTRLEGGKDAGSPRYIFTQLSPLTRLIFHPHDDPLMNYLRDDNLEIEPEWYMPIIPMILVNGADGIGTGWMTKIPNHNPREIIENLQRLIRGEEPVPMKPWYKNFKGEIQELGGTRFVTSGEISVIDDEQVEITELPVGMWTQKYKEHLETLLDPSEKDEDDESETEENADSFITGYNEYNTDVTVKFQIFMRKETLEDAKRVGLHKIFKLQNTISTTSMCAFDRYGVLRKYDSATQILEEFFDVRLEFYAKRKAYLEGMLEAELNKLTNQARQIGREATMEVPAALLEELKKIENKTASDLWQTDLDALLKKMDEMDEAEQKSAKLAAVYLPSPAIRVEPEIGSELKKKYEKADQIKINKKEPKKIQKKIQKQAQAEKPAKAPKEKKAKKEPVKKTTRGRPRPSSESECVPTDNDDHDPDDGYQIMTRSRTKGSQKK